MEKQIELHSKYMFYYCKKLCKDIDEAKELLSEVTLHLLEKVSDKYDESRDFIAWVRVVIKRIYYNNKYVRNVKKTIYNTQKRETTDSKDFFLFSESYLITKSDAVNKLIVQDVENLISKLPERVYKIFKMVSEGYDYDSIATEMKVSRQNINSTVSNYRKKLKKQYNE